MFHSIGTRQITHTSYHGFYSCGVFKDKFQQQQKQSSVKIVMHLTSVTKLDYDMKKKTRLDMNMLQGTRSISDR